MNRERSIVDTGPCVINGFVAWGMAGLVGGLNLASMGLELPVSTAHHLAVSILVPGVIGALLGWVDGRWGMGKGDPTALLHPLRFSRSAGQVILLGLAAHWAYTSSITGWAAAVAACAVALVLPVRRSTRRARPFAWAVAVCAWWIGVSLWVQAGTPWRPGHHRPATSSAVRPGMLLLTLDTVAARHLGCYGAPGDPTPHLDGLAREGVVFSRAVTTAPYTLPSLTSMATGLRPARHGVRGNAWPLSEEVVLFGDHLALADIDMAAGTDFDIPAHLDRGFQQTLRSTPRDLPPLRRLLRHWGPYGGWFDTDDSSVPLTLAARRWIHERSREPGWLLWLHYFDDAPHAPYRAPGPYGTAFVDESYSGPANGELQQLLEWTGSEEENHPTREDRDHTIALYRGELHWLDAQIGLLLDALRRTGAYDRSWVVVVADHGEQFGTDGTFQHGRSLRSDVLHVPLIVKPPRGEFTGGTRVDRLVSVTDIFPTILEIYGLPVPADIDGRPLIRSTDNGTPSLGALPRLVVSESATVASPRLGNADGLPYGIAVTTESGLRFVHAPETGESRVFDLRADPGEKVDLALADPTTAQLLHDRALRELGISDMGELLPGAPENPRDTRTLQSLGYVP